MYCKICNSCGEDGCCPATICTNHKDGEYCETNQKTLKVSYYTLREFYDFLYEDKTKNKEYIDKLNEIEDRIEDLY